MMRARKEQTSCLDSDMHRTVLCPVERYAAHKHHSMPCKVSRMLCSIAD